RMFVSAMAPFAGVGLASLNFIPTSSFGAYFFSQSTSLFSAYTDAGPLVSPPRLTDEPTGRQFSTRMPQSSTGSPLGIPGSPLPAMDSHASVNRQPRDGSFRP